MLTIEQLYDLNHTLAADYLRQFTYPWEALAGIKAEILRIGAALDSAGKTVLVLLAPVITDDEIPFAAQERCLSLDGERPCLRYQQILMEYQDEQLQRHVQRFSGFTAQVIQHEVDHLEGIII